jgi:hypothetical protein
MSVQGPAKLPSIAHAESAGKTLERTAAFEVLARAGFGARALIYGIIGILAVKLALGAGGKAADQAGALETIAHQPFGTLLLILVAIGLTGYSLWRLFHAVFGHGPESSDDALDRVAALGSGLSYAAMCAVAVGILLGSGGGSSSENPSKTTAGVFGWPAGTWLVGLTGALFVGIGLYQGYRAFTKDFLEDTKTERMGSKTKRVFEWVAIFGHLARMIVFGLIGAFLIKAAVDYNPSKAVGLDGALAKLAHQPYAPALLGLVATGLVAFALYSLLDARFRRI